MFPPVFAPQLKNPQYPASDTDRPLVVGAYLEQRNFLEPAERIVRLERAAAGCRNATWRVETTARSFFVKQFTAWPTNGTAAPSAHERFRAECQFYRAARIADGVERALPALLHHDARAECVILEDVGGASDPFATLTPAEAEALTWILVRLHHHSQSVPSCARYRSGELVGWRMAQLFRRAPGSRRRGAHGRWLARLATQGERVRHALEDALALLDKDGSGLVHGDFTAQNWLRAADGTWRIVDPEFSFFGPPEFDAGALLASLLYARQERPVVEAAASVIAHGCLRYCPRLTAAYAAAHLGALLENPARDPRAPRGPAAAAAMRRLARAIADGSLDALVATRAS